MAESVARQRDWFAPAMTLVTVVVAVWSLYFSGVQAEVARKTFEVTVNEAHAGLQKEIADLQRQCATAATDPHLADVLGRIADLQTKLAEQQRRAGTAGAGLLADVQQQLAELQRSFAHLKSEQDRKDQEIASLRASLSAASQPRITAPFLSSTGPAQITSLAQNPFPLPGKLGVSGTWNFAAPPIAPAVDDSWQARVKAAFLDLWSIFCKYPGPSFYFVIAALVALSKLFGQK
jgi:hypothetical protein